MGGDGAGPWDVSCFEDGVATTSGEAEEVPRGGVFRAGVWRVEVDAREGGDAGEGSGTQAGGATPNSGLERETEAWRSDANEEEDKEAEEGWRRERPPAPTVDDKEEEREVRVEEEESFSVGCHLLSFPSPHRVGSTRMRPSRSPEEEEGEGVRGKEARCFVASLSSSSSSSFMGVVFFLVWFGREGRRMPT